MERDYHVRGVTAAGLTAIAVLLPLIAVVLTDASAEAPLGSYAAVGGAERVATAAAVALGVLVLAAAILGIRAYRYAVDVSREANERGNKLRDEESASAVLAEENRQLQTVREDDARSAEAKLQALGQERRRELDALRAANEKIQATLQENAAFFVEEHKELKHLQRFGKFLGHDVKRLINDYARWTQELLLRRGTNEDEPEIAELNDEADYILTVVDTVPGVDREIAEHVSWGVQTSGTFDASQLVRRIATRYDRLDGGPDVLTTETTEKVGSRTQQMLSGRRLEARIDMGIELRGDSHHFRLALEQLIRNAYEFSRELGGYVHVKFWRGKQRAPGMFDTNLLIVNRGEPIPEGLNPLALDATTRNKKRHGAGLYLAELVAEGFGSTIKLENVPNMPYSLKLSDDSGTHRIDVRVSNETGLHVAGSGSGEGELDLSGPMEGRKIHFSLSAVEETQGSVRLSYDAGSDRYEGSYSSRSRKEPSWKIRIDKTGRFVFFPSDERRVEAKLTIPPAKADVGR